ncbi:MAG: hypothetical protein U9N86_06195 [Bacteroidota bacterium]|nr:hypothetical protein [Bacteroidota bacterium]
MTTSIYFTESKDFKLIKERILNQENDYLVYVYADTTNIKIPKDLIRELPIYGNNLIWVNTAEFDNSQLVNHVVLTIGQYLIADDSIEFFIACKTAKYEKAIGLLKSEGIQAELILPTGAITEKKKPGRRGRPKGSKNAVSKLAATTQTAEDKPVKKKRGRPKKEKTEETKTAAKKSGRKPGRPKKVTETKVRKKRVEKTISQEDITAKLQQFPSKDGDVELMQKKLFALGKVKRPKFDIKLSGMIQTELAIGASEADSLITKMKETGMMNNSGKGGRIMYKD